MSDDKVTIGGALGYAWSLWRQNWRAIWPALALNSLAASALFAGDISHNQALSLPASLVLIVTETIVYGAVFRIAFAADHAGDAAYKLNPSGVQWSAIEWRMLAAKILIGLFFAIIAALVLVGLFSLAFGMASSRGVDITKTITADAMQAALGPTVTAILGAALVVVICALIFASVRLMLALPATADRNRISVLSTWRLTRGQFWRILLSMVCVSLPIIISASIIGGMVIAAAGGTPTSAPAGGALAAAVVLGVALGAIATPLISAALAYFYRRLRTPV